MTATFFSQADNRMRRAEEAAAAQVKAAQPAHRLGLAQQAIRDALRLPPEQVHAHLAEALGRIEDPEDAA